MLEVILLAVIVIGLYRRRDERWEWNRARLRRAFADLSVEGERAVAGVRRSGPGIVSQCIADVRSLVRDALDVLDPNTRRRLARGARRLATSARGAAAGPQPGVRRRVAGATTMPTSPASSSDPAYARLQRRYLEGGISLEQYMEEARHLQHIPELGS